MLDYEVLRFIWWILIAVLLIGFAITDGFDMGVLNLLPVIGKSNFCSMANCICNIFLKFLSCDGTCTCCIILPSGWF